jgi:hypothetical protein
MFEKTKSEQEISSQYTFKSNFSRKIDEISKNADLVKSSCQALNSAAIGDLDQLAKLRKFDEFCYDKYLGVDELFTKSISSYKTGAQQFNEALDTRIEEARKFVIDAKDEERRQEKLALLDEIAQRDARINESESRADELGLYLRAEQQKTTGLEYQLGAERLGHEKIEGKIDSLGSRLETERDICAKRDAESYQKITGHIGQLDRKIEDLRDSGNKQPDYSKDELRKNMAEISSLLESYSNSQKSDREQFQKLIEDKISSIESKIYSAGAKEPERSLSSNFIKSVSEEVGEPATYQLSNLKRAALGRLGNSSYESRLRKIIDITTGLPVTDYSEDIIFLKKFEKAMLSSFESGDLRDAMENSCLDKDLVKDAMKSLQGYILRCLEKYQEIKESGKLIDAA